jgi:hypothetical protein
MADPSSSVKLDDSNGRSWSSRTALPGNGGWVMVSRLKLYQADDHIDSDLPPAPEADIRVRLGDLLPLVAFAQKLQFIWLKDFLDDEVKVTDDLYRVLQSFRALRPVA